MVAHGSIISTIEKFISLNRLPHLLFYGPPGTGKTSTILAVARKLYPTTQSFRNNVLELNASDERGIDVVRDQIKSFAGTRMVFQQKGQTQFKLVILDEADQMTQAAQGALRRGRGPASQESSTRRAELPVHSGRTIHAQCSILYHLQLCESHYSSYSIQMHQVSLCTSPRIRSRAQIEPRGQRRVVRRFFFSISLLL